MMITITKVVTRNFFLDFFSRVQNLAGINLTSYEKMINKGIKQIQDELIEKNITMEWYRYEISQLTNGAVAMMFYGDSKDEPFSDRLSDKSFPDKPFPDDVRGNIAR